MNLKKLAAVALAVLLLSSCASEKPQEPVTEPQEIPQEIPQEEIQTPAPEPSAAEEAPAEEAADETLLPEALQNQKHTLRFDENGEFRVLVFGDVQATPPAPSERTLNAMETILRREEPDLVLFAGDNAIACSTTTLLRNYLTAMTGYLEENEIPWAHVYGNHDDENALSRKQQQVIYEEFDYCVSQAGPDDIKGVGNYVLPVYSADESRTDPVFSVWGLDSGAYITDPGLPGKQAVLNNTMYQGLKGSSYAYIPFTQIRWYFNTSEEIESFAGHKVPGMMLFHIPLQEFYEIWLNKEQTGTEGTREDPICAGPLNSGLFTAMVERGDIKAVVCGHDHINDYAGEFCGIQLCYASNIGYDTYHNEALMGGRVFVIHEDDPDEVETYMSYVSGIKLTNLAGAITAVADFEAADSYTVTDNAQASDGGESGSKAVTIAREGGVTLTAPLRLGSGRYLRAWVSVPADSELQSLSLVNYDDIRFTADVTKTEIHYLPDGESEWKTAAAGEGLPAGFTGLVAAPCADLKASHGQLLADTIVKGYYFTCDGSVIVDNVRMLTSYKK